VNNLRKKLLFLNTLQIVLFLFASLVMVEVFSFSLGVSGFSLLFSSDIWGLLVSEEIEIIRYISFGVAFIMVSGLIIVYTSKDIKRDVWYKIVSILNLIIAILLIGFRFLVESQIDELVSGFGNFGVIEVVYPIGVILIILIQAFNISLVFGLNVFRKVEQIFEDNKQYTLLYFGFILLMFTKVLNIDLDGYYGIGITGVNLMKGFSIIFMSVQSNYYLLVALVLSIVGLAVNVFMIDKEKSSSLNKILISLMLLFILMAFTLGQSSLEELYGEFKLSMPSGLVVIYSLTAGFVLVNDFISTKKLNH
jgi:hypothetical protein